MIRNLISNAIKFSNEGSEVLVSLTEEDGMAIVSVKDSGCGIDEENQKKLLHTDSISVPSALTTRKVRDWDCCCARISSSRMEANSGFTSKKGEDLHSVSRCRCWRSKCYNYTD